MIEIDRERDPTMTKYLLLYRAPVSATAQMADASPEAAQAGMDAWMTWAGKAGDAIVDMGSPVAPTTSVGADRESGDFIGGYSILEADSADALEALLDGHPHFQLDGAAIEVHEFLPLPGM
jgi:hypothetical protein